MNRNKVEAFYLNPTKSYTCNMQIYWTPFPGIATPEFFYCLFITIGKPTEIITLNVFWDTGRAINEKYLVARDIHSIRWRVWCPEPVAYCITRASQSEWTKLQFHVWTLISGNSVKTIKMPLTKSVGWWNWFYSGSENARATLLRRIYDNCYCEIFFWDNWTF